MNTRRILREVFDPRWPAWVAVAIGFGCLGGIAIAALQARSQTAVAASRRVDGLLATNQAAQKTLDANSREIGQLLAGQTALQAQVRQLGAVPIVVSISAPSTTTTIPASRQTSAPSASTTTTTRPTSTTSTTHPRTCSSLPAVEVCP